MNLLNEIGSGKEVLWFNPSYKPNFRYEDEAINKELVFQAEKRLLRFAPVIMHYFPETALNRGIIESELQETPGMKSLLDSYANESNKQTSVTDNMDDIKCRLFIKRDSDLQVAGSVKARGGIHEVLKHAEDVAIENGIISGTDDDYMKLTSESAREILSQYKIQVGSTGNLGLSIGIMSRALGFQAIVHMSMDAKEWKKKLLREKGATVIEYEGDYGQAVKKGREQSDADPYSYFVDDERSVNLFSGYAVAGLRIKKQFEDKGILCDEHNQVFVYIPCGVGGAPGGIAYGLKMIYGENIHIFFAEPTQAPCMLAGLVSGKFDQICVQNIGLSGVTKADGLAVSRPSKLVCRLMDSMLSGECTVEDKWLNIYQKMLLDSENIFIEPSSAAAYRPYDKFVNSGEVYKYIKNVLMDKRIYGISNIIWSTGGALMPAEERVKC